eukprot:gnl/MRDRNA2_/MRDRNA2_84154_c0_seq1.p1 gnl/MRDRNA2_/MRDRNA2_84154_c0~~gnl/MRDRNA2_/MRDRNA2_84154_c0_seq1.p1  ORF type:complete len:648 (+),score=-10.40 gnl/MRDRNA2_/MRDRNA2_84154_c0_seq1:526-2469(+)
MPNIVLSFVRYVPEANLGYSKHIERVSLRYEDGYKYQNVFSFLVKLETHSNLISNEEQKRGNVSIRWELALNKKFVAFFTLPVIDYESRLFVGDELRVRLHSPFQWVGTGRVIGLTDKGEIKLEMKNSKDLPKFSSSGYHLESVWNPIKFERMQEALRVFGSDETALSGYIYHSILGIKIHPRLFNLRGYNMNFYVPGLPQANLRQKCIILDTLSRQLTLIQGPPGTGKTVISCNIIFCMLQMALGPILVSAPSNAAVDQLLLKIDRIGLNVVKLSAKTRELLNLPIDHLTLRYKVINSNMSTKLNAEFTNYRKLKILQKGLNNEDEERYTVLKRALEKDILFRSEIICATCSSGSDSRISKMKFRQVLIDEATQASEPEVLIPIINGSKQLVLVGDHFQLGPFILNKKADIAGLSLSLFERLIFAGVKPYKLTTQYRMHPLLTEFPASMFYENILKNGLNSNSRTAKKKEFPWPQPDKPTVFHAVYGIEELSNSGMSYLNRAEAIIVARITTALVRNGVIPSQIGVITPYDGQRAYITLIINETQSHEQNNFGCIEVASVDAFQGREKDYIVLSCVRSNDYRRIGFLSDPRRLNVALTRSKYGLIIVGNPTVLKKHHFWSNLIQFCFIQEVLVEGPTTNLKTVDSW